MLIARWLILFAGLATCVSVALFMVTREPVFWRIAKRIFVGTIAAGLVFFAVLILERLILI